MTTDSLNEIQFYSHIDSFTSTRKYIPEKNDLFERITILFLPIYIIF